MREVILDIETTGLDVKKHKIIEIGAIEFVDKSPTGKKFHRYINPEIPVSKEAYRVHGISDAFLRNKPKFVEISQELLAFLLNSNVVAHNVKFDVGFINKELQEIGKTNIISNDRMICTAKIAAKKFPGTRINLNALCKRFKIDIKHRQLHGALIDAELLMRVYTLMTGHEQTSLAGNMEENQNNTNKKNNTLIKNMLK